MADLDKSAMSDKDPITGPSTDADEYDQQCENVNAIAQPLAKRKLAKKIYKLVKKATKQKDKGLVQGLKDVQRALNRKQIGVVVLAGNVYPIDIYSHIAGLCEELSVPYVYTPSKEHLGLAAGHKRPNVVALIKRHDDYEDLYDEVYGAVDKLPLPVVAPGGVV